MADETTTIAMLMAKVSAFVRARDWEKFHRPSNLAKAISIEAAELLELFQWREDSQPLDAVTQARVEEELADVVIYCLSAANTLGVDLSDIVVKKLARNESRYPAGEWRGRARDASRDP